jgi:hypothetical protein
MMRREKKRLESEEKYSRQRERLRQKRQLKNSSSVEACQPAGDEHAGGRNVSAEGMEGSPGEIAVAGFFSASGIPAFARTGHRFVTPGFPCRNLPRLTDTPAAVVPCRSAAAGFFKGG